MGVVGSVMSAIRGMAMSNAMWGGRFASGPSAIMEEINASIGFDNRLAAQDIRGSKAHAAMLAQTGIIGSEDADAITAGLTRIAGEIEAGTFTFKRALEDIHMNVEARLADLIGEPAGRLHTARSRNDQVALDFRSGCATRWTGWTPGCATCRGRWPRRPLAMPRP